MGHSAGRYIREEARGGPWYVLVLLALFEMFAASEHVVTVNAFLFIG